MILCRTPGCEQPPAPDTTVRHAYCPRHEVQLVGAAFGLRGADVHSRPFRPSWDRPAAAGTILSESESRVMDGNR